MVGRGSTTEERGFPVNSIKGAKCIQVRDIQYLIDDRHAFGRVERDIPAATFNELESRDASIVAELGNESVIVATSDSPLMLEIKYEFVTGSARKLWGASNPLTWKGNSERPLKKSPIVPQAPVRSGGGTLSD